MWFVLLLLILGVLVWYWRWAHVYMLIRTWNLILTPIRDHQNRSDCASPALPGFQWANKTRHQVAADFHTQVVKHHDAIVAEIRTLLGTGYQPFPVIETDHVQAEVFGPERRWKSIWIKLINSYPESSALIPTLTRIVKQYEHGISLLHVSIFYPGTEVAMHTGIAAGVWRYHYGLSVPEGDVHLQLMDHKYHWLDREGILWDDTLPHAAWNRTTSPRIVIFADIYRELPWALDKLNRAVFWLIDRSKHVAQIRARLAAHNTRID